MLAWHFAINTLDAFWLYEERLIRRVHRLIPSLMYFTANIIGYRAPSSICVYYTLQLFTKFERRNYLATFKYYIYNEIWINRSLNENSKCKQVISFGHYSLIFFYFIYPSKWKSRGKHHIFNVTLCHKEEEKKRYFSKKNYVRLLICRGKKVIYVAGNDFPLSGPLCNSSAERCASPRFTRSYSTSAIWIFAIFAFRSSSFFGDRVSTAATS